MRVRSIRAIVFIPQVRAAVGLCRSPIGFLQAYVARNGGALERNAVVTFADGLTALTGILQNAIFIVAAGDRSKGHLIRASN
jgi:hypothetical protein